MSFRVVYPAKGRVTFDGGMNSKFTRDVIADNESPDCKNVRFGNGSVETRGGSTRVNTAPIGSFVGDSLYVRHVDTGSETMVAFAGGTAWYLQGTSFITIPSAQSLFTAGTRFGAAEYENYLFVGNGGTIPYKYNGDFTRHGIYPPTSTSTVASQATGVLTGDYRYKIVNLNSGLVESDAGPAMATFTAASATLRVSLQTFAASYGVAARRIYRTAAGGTTYNRVATVSDNTTTTYDDNLADASLGAAAPTDAGVPPKYRAVVYHANRLFMIEYDNPNFVWYTELNNPYTVKATNFIKIGDGTSDLGYGLDVYENNVLVRCAKSDHIIYMPDTDPTNWKPVRIQSPYGSKSPFGSFSFEGSLMFPAVQSDKFVGFAAISGIGLNRDATFLTVSTAGSDLMSNPIEPEMFQVQEAYQENISSIVFKNRAYIAVTHGDAQTQNNRIWVFDFSRTNLSKRKAYAWSPDTGINPAQFAVYNGSLYFLSSTDPAYLYQYETTTFNDNGAAIDSYFWTKEFSADGNDAAAIFKDFRYAKALVEQAGDYNMDFYHRVDSDRGGGNREMLDLNPGGSLWGSFNWGQDWGGGQDQDDKKVFLGADRGERIQFKFSNQNTVNQKFKVHGLKFYFNEKGFR
jgi:hypothetical protein